MKYSRICIMLCAAVVAVTAVAQNASAQETTVVLKLYGSGLPPGPRDYLPTTNPLPGIYYELRYETFQLTGLEQIPQDAEITWVTYRGVLSGSFDVAEGVNVSGTIRPMMTNGSAFYAPAGVPTEAERTSLEVYGPNRYEWGGGWGSWINPLTSVPWTRDNLVNFSFGWWVAWRWDLEAQVWGRRVSVMDAEVQVTFKTPPPRYTISPSPLHLSTGDTNRFFTVTQSPSTGQPFSPSFTLGASRNPNSSCSATPTFSQVSGVGFANSNVRAAPAGCSNIFDGVRSIVSGTLSTNAAQLVVPPQIMIKTVVGEAGGQPGDIDQQALLAVGRNRFGDRDFPGGRTATWQAVLIPGQFYGASDPTTNGPDQELRNSALVFTGEVGDIVGGSPCYWSPTTTQWTNIQAALKSQTKTEPTNVGIPSCYASVARQIVVKSSIGVNTRGGDYSNAPAFVFLRKRKNNDPAVVEIP
jgi:hypothetical protein